MSAQNFQSLSFLLMFKFLMRPQVTSPLGRISLKITLSLFIRQRLAFFLQLAKIHVECMPSVHVVRIEGNNANDWLWAIFGCCLLKIEAL